MRQGYYGYPSLHHKTLVFTAEGDLWHAPLDGGRAQRLTLNAGKASCAHFSSDGKDIAFTGTDEGYGEVYAVPFEGGTARRLTFLGGHVQVIGWQGDDILFASSHASPFKDRHIYRIAKKGGLPQRLPVGPANFISYNPEGKGCVVQRHGYGYASWKRYRGGTAGELWIDPNGTGFFKKLIDLKSNNVRPLWIGGRIYFLSDHEGHGNLYSCTPHGHDLKRHTHFEDFYLKQISTDGERILFARGADLGCYHIASDTVSTLEITYPSTFPDHNRAFVSPRKNLTDSAISPDGGQLALATRGRVFRMTPWEGPVWQEGEENGVSYRLVSWLFDGEHVVALRDEGQSEVLEIFSTNPSKKANVLSALDVGQVFRMKASPCSAELLVSNHRNELIHLDLKGQKITILDRASCGGGTSWVAGWNGIQNFNWSPDGKWVVYSIQTALETNVIRLIHLKTQEKTDLTSPLLKDYDPSFDPEGRFIYFLSCRHFSPQYDTLSFDLYFSKGSKPYAITLQKDTLTPFVPPLKPEENEKKPDEEKGEDKKDQPLRIDLEGIQNRIVPVPVPEGRYRNIQGTKDRIFFLSLATELPTNEDLEGEEHFCDADLECYDLSTLKHDTFVPSVGSYTLSGDHKMILLYTQHKLRVIGTGEKPDEQDQSYRAGGWVDWKRIRLSIHPVEEWRHMFDEAWSLQRDFFWNKEMSHVDWDAVYRRYQPLVERLSTQDDLMELIWDMQGELGSSHAYVWSSEDPTGPSHPVGRLGVDLAYLPEHEAYRITALRQGDVWDPKRSSPLLRPGMNIDVGDLVVSVNGRSVSSERSPPSMLVDQSGQRVVLGIKSSPEQDPREIIVTPIASETELYYREWVNKNRRLVHEKTEGRVGYIHIPDMSEEGFAEFHRGFLSEYDREGLVVDVRFNRGGHVSGLLLEKLMRQRLGYDHTRWHGTIPYFAQSPHGPMAALCNEYTASDGDMFAHSFKLLKLGPLIGKRTWGGVIGISVMRSLLDGSIVTPPQYAVCFKDVGWDVENKGTDPDIEIDITPQDHEADQDPQLERGIQEVLDQMAQKPVEGIPTFPNLAAPSLG
eukprot:g8564.t1